MTLPDRRLRLVHDHGQIEDCTLGLRRFLGIPDQEHTELTFIESYRASVEVIEFLPSLDLQR